MSTANLSTSPSKQGAESIAKKRDGDTLQTSLHSEKRPEWLEPLLLTMKTGAAASKVASIPYVKGAFGIAVLFLETVDKMKKNREHLKELSESIVNVMDILRQQLSLHQASTADKLTEYCQEFKKLMEDILNCINQMQGKAKGTRGLLREFFKSGSVADQINEYERKIDKFARNLQLWIQTFGSG
ncbi:hypothetical protein GGX14DRAFT_555548 [Mycena pura]|uniref:Uncharacterized protein n=1 Tax=Mycena pura TaxID=153505 RepID=A0AAD7E3N0_9AGAR|nr:hypothetical protein GGX14DRAFT_555548 [Mycena pura]